MPSKKTTLLICSVMVFAAFLIYPRNAAAILEMRPQIDEGKWIYENFSFSDTEPVPFTVQTAGNVSIWFLAPAEFVPLMNLNGSINITTAPADLNSIRDGTLVNGVYTIERQWTMSYLNTTYDLPIQVTVSADGKTSSSVNVYMIVQNHGPGAQRVMIQLEPSSTLLDHLDLSTKWMIVFLMFGLVFWLFWSARENSKSPEKQHKAKMYYGFAAGFGFGLAARVFGEIVHYTETDAVLYVFPQDKMQGSIGSLLFGIRANTAIYPVILLMLLSLAFVGFSYIVEKIVKNRKPILTVNLIAAAVSAPFILAFPGATDIIILYIIASIGLAAATILIVYVTVAKSTSGAIRRQAIYTMIGVVLPIVFQVFGTAFKLGTFQYSSEIQGILFNSVVIIGLLLFYKSKV
jgi:hypothetical protein